MNKIKVSIVSIAYNQEKYIAQALESFVSQKTNFKFEAIIADDGSSDNTPNIIKEYAKKYPNIIKPILRKKNIGIQPNFIDALKQASGDYIALCEGDDYWTDALKIQKQVDFLESNLDYNVVFHPVRVFFENHEAEDVVYPESSNAKDFTIYNLLRSNFIQTNSVMYRKIDYTILSEDIMPFDWYLHVMHVQHSKIGFLNQVMSAYRRNSSGVWWSSTDDEANFMKKIFRQHIKLFSDFKALYRNEVKYLTIIEYAENDFVKRAVSLNIDNQAFLQEATELSPKVMASVVLDIHRMKVAADEQNNRLRHELEVANTRYEDTLSSRTYKTGDAILQPLRKMKRQIRNK